MKCERENEQNIAIISIFSGTLFQFGKTASVHGNVKHGSNKSKTDMKYSLYHSINIGSIYSLNWVWVEMDLVHILANLEHDFA